MRTQVLQQVEVRPILTVILASFLIGACAQIRIPLGFTPVPFTGQTLAVMAIGARLGSRKGALAALCYLMEGAMGWPVFAGGNGGAIVFFGATGGYLLAYPLEAFLVGWLLERRHRLLAIFLPCSLQLAIGSLWMIPFVGIDRAFLLGFYPFFLVEIGKAILATLCSKKDPT